MNSKQKTVQTLKINIQVSTKINCMQKTLDEKIGTGIEAETGSAVF